MSRFFRAASDSESESESSDEGIQETRPAAATRVIQFSDDEEETKREVKSAKDKRYEEMQNVIKQIKNHKKIKDMASLLTDFENLNRAFEKSRKVTEQEGIPRFYLRALADMDDFVAECWDDKEWRKSISKNNAKGLSTLRQKLRKHIRDNLETEITQYRENPDEGEEPDLDDKEESDDEEKSIDLPVMKAAPLRGDDKSKDRKAAPVRDEDDDDDDDDDDFDWGDDSDESSSDSDDDMPVVGKLTAEYFLKSTTEAEAARREERKREKKAAKKATAKESGPKGDDFGGADEWTEVKGGVAMPVEKPKMFSKDQEITVDAVNKKLIEIVSSRGKKGTDRAKMIEMLRELNSIAQANNLGPGIDIKLRMNIMAAIYDYNPNISTCMKADIWENACLPTIKELLIILMENDDVMVGEYINEESEQLVNAPYRVRGCILTMVERMDDEFTKILQACDAHSTEFVERLQDEKNVCDLIDRMETYLEHRGTSEEICRIYLRKIEHMYYKFDSSSFIDNQEKDQSSERVIERLCKYIYAKDSTDRLRTRAILCHIYHNALHDRWYQARDLMLMSHLQDNIQHSDVPTQILYNRTLVQLGLCGFRRGFIRDAHNALVDIQSSNRAKELLAQGLVPQRQHERTPEQEKIEKRRLLPYHQHINLELLECVYLVSAMLLEIPYMAAHELDVRKRMISKNFHHVLKMSERQTLTGPPESMREHVVAASKAMKNGDWRHCKNFIINEKMNAKVWDLFYQTDKVRDMICSKIQEESLRTYLFRYSFLYDTLSLPKLAAMFELGEALVHSIISKMIINEELMASLDEPTQIVVMHRTEPTQLQSLALQLSEKVAALVDNNERLLEIKQGNYYFNKANQRDNYNQQNQQWARRQNRQQQRY